ncbi:MAG: hypothetical protein LKJ44_07310 [Bifidobacteriaceae bacterium]|jgi:hypothetical protein|nr:hypothetical protein [Bifidobacteriaceae bacterium]
MTKNLVTEDGIELTPELIAKMADEAENGFPNSILERAEGRPWEHDPKSQKS